MYYVFQNANGRLMESSDDDDDDDGVIQQTY